MNTRRLRCKMRTIVTIAAFFSACPDSHAEEPPVLQELRAAGNQVRILEGEEALSRDGEIRYLRFSEVKTLAPLTSHAKHLTGLIGIRIMGDADLSGLAELPNLQQLDLENFGGDLSAITKLLKNKNTHDYSLLADMPQLASLNIHDSEFSDLSPLAKLTKLRSLVIGRTKVSDLTPVAALLELETIGAAGVPIRDLTPLANLGQDFGPPVPTSNLTPSSEKVVSSYVQAVPIRLPLQEPDAWTKTIEEAFQKAFFQNLGSQEYQGNCRLAFLIDLPLYYNTTLLRTKLFVTSVAAKDGSNILLQEIDRPVEVPVHTSGRYFGDIRIPLRADGDFKNPRVVKGEFVMVLPTSISVARFNAGDPPGTKRPLGKGTITLRRLANDVMEYTTENVSKNSIEEVYDKTGHLIAARARRTTGRSIGRWQGKIAYAKIFAIADTREIRIPLEVDISKVTQWGGKPRLLKLEQNSQPLVRYDRTPHVINPTLHPSKIGELRVERWRENAIAINLPTAAKRVEWEAHAFGENASVVDYDNNPTHKKGGEFSSSRINVIVNGVPDLRRIFGAVQCELPVGGGFFKVEKPQEGDTSVITLTDGRQIEVTFRDNLVNIENLRDVEARSCAAYDAEGRRLLSRHGSKHGGEFYGIPHRVDIELYTNIVIKTTRFDITIGEHDAAAFKNYQKTIARHKRVVAALKQIQKAWNQGGDGFGENIAGLRYLYPLRGDASAKQLIPAELAAADPIAAKVFDYGHMPYLGYRFVLLVGKFPNINAQKVTTFNSEKGEFTLLPIDSHNAYFLAVPAQANEPTFGVSGGYNSNWHGVYSKVIGNKIPSKPPSDMRRWKQFKSLVTKDD